MWTRRQLGAAVLGTAAASPVGNGLAARAAAIDGRFALAPRVGSRWAKHQHEQAPKLVQLRDGVRLQAGPMGAVDRNGLAIWSRALWGGGDFRLSFGTTKLDANVGVGSQSLFFLLYFGVQGDGGPGHPANLADWPATTVPYTHAYADHVRGARLSFYYQAPGANGETGPVGCAYFKADGSRNSIPPRGDAAFPGLRGVSYAWTVRRAGDAVTVRQKDGATIRSVTFASAALGQFAAAGNFGLLVAPGRDVDVTNFSVAAA